MYAGKVQIPEPFVPKNIPGTLAVTQASSPKPVPCLKTENFGADQPHHLKEMVCLTSTLPT